MVVGLDYRIWPGTTGTPPQVRIPEARENQRILPLTLSLAKRADDGNRTRMTSLEVRSRDIRSELCERRSWSRL
jgi:hypothetical protein